MEKKKNKSLIFVGLTTMAITIFTVFVFCILSISLVNLEHNKDKEVFFKHGEAILSSEDYNYAVDYNKKKLEELGYENVQIHISLEHDEVSVVTMFATKDSGIPRLLGKQTSEHKYVGKN